MSLSASSAGTRIPAPTPLRLSRRAGRPRNGYAPARAGHGWPAKGGAIPEGYYVQVRYPQGRRWVTVAVCDARPTASGIGADAYRNLCNGRGETPQQVRVLSATQLRREGGQRDVSIADADVARGAAR